MPNVSSLHRLIITHGDLQKVFLFFFNTCFTVLSIGNELMGSNSDVSITGKNIGIIPVISEWEAFCCALESFSFWRDSSSMNNADVCTVPELFHYQSLIHSVAVTQWLQGSHQRATTSMLLLYHMFDQIRNWGWCRKIMSFEFSGQISKNICHVLAPCSSGNCIGKKNKQKKNRTYTAAGCSCVKENLVS